MCVCVCVGGGVMYKAATRLMFVTCEFDLSSLLTELRSFHSVPPNVCVRETDSQKISHFECNFGTYFFAFPTRTQLCSIFDVCIGIQINPGICKSQGLVRLQTCKEKIGNGENEEKEGKIRKTIR